MKYKLPSVDISDEALLGFQGGKSAAIQHVIFVVGHEYCALPILNVYEIKRWYPGTPIPNQPECIEGVINLRGEVVPIMDLALRFDMADCVLPQSPLDYAPKVVLVMQLQTNEHKRLTGLVIDSVIDVAPIESDMLQDIPDFGGRIDQQFIQGICDIRGHTVMVLALEALLNLELMT